MKYCPENGEVGIYSIYILNTEWCQFNCTYMYLNDSGGQIATSFGKEGVDHKKGWEHVWLMGNNQVLKQHKLNSWKMAILRSLPVSWNFSGLVNKRFLDLSHHLKPKAWVHDFGVIECGYSVYIWWIRETLVKDGLWKKTGCIMEISYYICF